jgi:DNA-directed RNA polymerase specialized sigma24 family protein
MWRAMELAFEEFERVLNELPVNCRAALLRQRRDGWSYQQIAQELDVSVNTVKDYIVKALQHFQVHFSLPAKHASALKGRR